MSFLDWGLVLPPSTLLLYCKITPLSYVSKIILYAIFIVFGLQIPSYYVQDILWTKLPPAGPFPGVYIIHWGQLDKMQQLLSISKISHKILLCPIRLGWNNNYRVRFLRPIILLEANPQVMILSGTSIFGFPDVGRVFPHRMILGTVPNSGTYVPMLNFQWGVGKKWLCPTYWWNSPKLIVNPSFWSFWVNFILGRDV